MTFEKGVATVMRNCVPRCQRRQKRRLLVKAWKPNNIEIDLTTPYHRANTSQLPIVGPRNGDSSIDTFVRGAVVVARPSTYFVRWRARRNACCSRHHLPIGRCSRLLLAWQTSLYRGAFINPPPLARWLLQTTVYLAAPCVASNPTF